MRRDFGEVEGDGGPELDVGLEHAVGAAGTQLGQGRLGFLVGVCDGLVGLLDGRGLGLGHAQVHGQRDQPLLGAVVQVPLQAAPLGVARLDDPRP